MNPHDSHQLEDRIKDALNQPLERETRQRLAIAREQALQQTKLPMWRATAIPAMVLAGICAVALLLLMPAEQQLTPPGSVEAFDIISSPDALEMYQDLEFYAWLAVEEEQGV